MNYFELYDLPVKFKTDKARLRKKYLELSRRDHPDYFMQHDSAAQEEALENAALVNKAFITLGNADATLPYVLTLKGVLADGEKYQLPPAFLMEMLELNERVEDAEATPAQQVAVAREIDDAAAALYAPVKSAIENYTDGETPEETLEAIKDYYFKKKYFGRLKARLG